MQRHVGRLFEELLCAHEAGLVSAPAYMADLNLEIAEARYALSVAVLRDVAVLRAALGDRPEG